MEKSRESRTPINHHTRASGFALQTRGMDSSVAQPLQMIDTQPVDGGSYWINGLLTGLKRSELYLHRGGAPAVQSTTRQLLDSSTLVAETLSKLRRWGINTWADLLTPEERLTTELPHVLPQDLQLPPDIIIEPHTSVRANSGIKQRIQKGH